MRAILKGVKHRVLRTGNDPLQTILGETAIIRINPNRIVLYGENLAERSGGGNRLIHAFHKRRRKMFVYPGGWDLDCDLFSELSTYRFIAEMKRYDLDYTKCSRFRELVKRVNEGEPVRYKNKELILATESDVHEFMKSRVEVCKSMRDLGYLPEKIKDHICVMVGRNGDLIKEVRGRHRLAIAQVFGVKEVLVLIRHVHPIWVEKQRKQFGRLPVHEVLKLAFRALEAAPGKG